MKFTAGSILCVMKELTMTIHVPLYSTIVYDIQRVSLVVRVYIIIVVELIWYHYGANQR